MHELSKLEPFAKSVSKEDSILVMERLKAPSVREVDVMKRAFILRAWKAGVRQSDIARMAGVSRQRVAQVIENLRDDLRDLAFPQDETLFDGRYARVDAIIECLNGLGQVAVLERWEDSEEFRFAMLKLVGYAL